VQLEQKLGKLPETLKEFLNTMKDKDYQLDDYFIEESREK